MNIKRLGIFSAAFLCLVANAFVRRKPSSRANFGRIIAAITFRRTAAASSKPGDTFTIDSAKIVRGTMSAAGGIPAG